MERRIDALNWWHCFTFEYQWILIVKYKHIIEGYPDRSPDMLTGREIEEIYVREKNLL